MERVETLLQKLQQQFKEGSSPQQLLITVQMLQHELNSLATQGNITEPPSVLVSMPVQPVVQHPVTIEFEHTDIPPEEKIIEVLQVDDEAIEAELEEIKRNADVMQKISAQSKPQLLFQPHEDDLPPTLSQQTIKPFKKEVNDVSSTTSSSVNDILKETITELSDLLTDVPVKDLKKAIGVNDRFLYINELFRGDEAMYERSIKTINGFSIWPEAEYWIRRELKTKLGWIDSHETVKQFDQLVKRRFS